MQIRHNPLSGGYCGEVPPLPIPNREVKLTCADGTALPCGRVGSRQFLKETTRKVVSFFVVPHCAVAWRLRCVACVALCCVAWRLRFVVLRAVTLCSRRSCYVSGGCSLPRWASPCCFVLRRAQNWHFCALFGFVTPIFWPFEHKIGFFVSEWAIFPRFLVVLTRKWGFCAREA